jgi:ADP-dependent NAD(P)H-hydrate dehydratase / NAD(P)H-hydrate epimerase
MNDPASFVNGFQEPWTRTDLAVARSIYKPRDPLSNKGSFGHALLLAGSHGKIGAALMAARACLTAGAGLLTTHLPVCGYAIMQTALPEAMVSVDTGTRMLTRLPRRLDSYQAIGVGPGIGTAGPTRVMIRKLFKSAPRPLVVDADALNIVSKDKKLLGQIPEDSILTPHPKEFDRLFGASATAVERIRVAHRQAIKNKLILILKGHYTGIFCPDGRVFFNTSGNAGMAKGGSGDVLTGMVTAMLSQNYPPADAAIFAVFLHGLAGDFAAEAYSEEAMMPTDLIACIGKAFKQLQGSADN